MQKKLVNQSKFLSLVLRHQPQLIGIELDNQGWVDVATLLTRCQQHGKDIDLEVLKQVVADNDKQRFAFNEDCTKIRANQGHSVAIDLQLAPTQPPTYLYHGTATRFLHSIRQQGLQKRSRQHVHLSALHQTAISVGSRHGVPHVLTVRAEAMYQAGYQFFISDNGVWLTDAVPVEYIEF